MNNAKTLFNSYLSLSGFPEAKMLYMVQGDKSPLTFELKDKNLETVKLNEKTGQAQVIDPETDTIKALSTCEIVDGRATFVIEPTLPVGKYEIYLKIGSFYFPSATQSFILQVTQAYDVVDVDVNDLQTIDIVVDALKEQISETIMEVIREEVNQVIANNPELFRGEKGKPLRFEDLTDEQLDQLKGENGESLTFDQLDASQQEAIRGYSAYQLARQDGYAGTEDEWLASLKGDKGDKGDTGDSAYEEALKQGFQGTEAEWLESLNGQDGTVAYEDLNESQRAALYIPPKIYTRDEYNNLSSYDPNTLYFIEEV